MIERRPSQGTFGMSITMNSQATSFARLAVAFKLRLQTWVPTRPVYEFPYIGYGTAERSSPQEAGLKHFLSLLSLSCVLNLVLVALVAGQTTNGSIRGTVVDPQSAAVAGANVTGRNMDTGLTVVATTSSAGLF